jgi:serine phosphatase RsbU (regulator of sigma subunit)/CHASE3 domain sensor protein
VRARRRLQLLFIPLLVLLVVHVALDSYVAHRRDIVRAEADERLRPARLALVDLQAGLVDQETGGRGYLITGEDRFLQPYRDGEARVDSRVLQLRDLLAHDPDLMAAVERVAGRVSAWRRLGAEFEIEAKRAGRGSEAAALVATGTGTELLGRARQEIADLQTAVDLELSANEAQLDDLGDRLTEVRVASAFAGLALLWLAGWLLSRWVTRPVTGLGMAVRKVAGGHLATPIPATGPPDFAELGRDVEAMRQRLVTEIEEAHAARAALTQRGMVVLALRDELAPGPLDVDQRLRIASRFQPAEGVVAGDWFDVVDLGEGRFAVALIDISGHGAGAGVFALKTKYLLIGALRNGLSPAASLRWLSGQLGDTGESFLTGVVVEISPCSGRLRYASAGHPPMLVCDRGVVTTLGPTGPLLGPLEADWSDAEAELAPAATLAIYSDGLVEAKGPDGSEFGVERLTDLLGSMPHGRDGCDPDVLADLCFAEVNGLSGGQRRDDITLVVVGRGSRPDDVVGGTDDVGGHLDPQGGSHLEVDGEAEASGVLDRHI